MYTHSQYRYHTPQLEGVYVGAALLESSVAGLEQTKNTKGERSVWLGGRYDYVCQRDSPRFQREMGTLLARVWLVLAQWRKIICLSLGKKMQWVHTLGS